MADSTRHLSCLYLKGRRLSGSKHALAFDFTCFVFWPINSEKEYICLFIYVIDE